MSMIRLLLQCWLHRPSLLLLLIVLLLTHVKADDYETCEDILEDSDSSSHYTCGPTGQVMCQDGWSGDLCNLPKCREGCHPLHGYCQIPGDCKCALGWRGARCDQCTPLPGCQQGFCNTTSFECLCDEGWTGKLCNIPKCKAGCHNSRGYCIYPGECNCLIGWGGNTCDECAPLHGCANGYCTKPLECRCHEGWTGPLCRIPLCAANCSISHGSCVNPGECRCETGWWGDDCNECHAYPGCQNGYCTRPWDCVCEEGWEGLLCDKHKSTVKHASFCDRNPSTCRNGGTCINVPGNRNFTCSCPSLFTGQRCEYLADSPFTISKPFLTFPTITTKSTTPDNAQVITTDMFTSIGNDSLVQHFRSAKLEPCEDQDKIDRKILLQNYARISFRTPDISSTVESSPRVVPLKVSERQLLPLPVFVPRAYDFVPSIQSQKDKSSDLYPILVFEIGNQQNTGLERNQINENRRVLRQQEDSSNLFLSDIVEAESTDKRRPTKQRIVRVNSFNMPFLISAGATALPRTNPFSPSTLRQPAITNLKLTDLMHSKAVDKPTPFPVPDTKPIIPKATPITSVKAIEIKELQEEDIFVTQESILQPQTHAKIIQLGNLRDENIVPEVHHDEFLGGGVHIGAHFVPHENKAFHEAFIELKKI